MGVDSYYWVSQKLYFYDKEYNKFENLTETKIEKLKSIINNYKIRSFNNEQDSLLSAYLKVLSYLLRDKDAKIKLSFDEKIFILIETIDPELNIFKEYFTATPYKSSEDKKATEQQLREKFGFFEPYLIKYENQLYRVLKQPTTFLSHVKIDLTDKLLKPAILVRDFDDLSDEKVTEILNKAFVFVAETEDNSKETISFNAYYSNNLLNINSIKERIAFFITVFDPDLNILRIYEEESKIEKAKERIIDEIGFFNPELIRLETIYHKRFCPDKKVSIWSL